MNLSIGKLCKNFKALIVLKRYVNVQRNNVLHSSINKTLTENKTTYNYNFLQRNLLEEENKESPEFLGYSLLIIPAITFVLGTWQIYRLKWKLNLIDDMKRRTSQDPVDLPENLNELNTKEYHKVKVRGKFLYEKEFTIGPKSLIKDGGANVESIGLISVGKINTGFNVITPFKLEDRDVTILVNRGWIPRECKNKIRQLTKEDDVREIVGVVRLNETRPPFIKQNSAKDGVWLYRDLNAMAELAGTAPIYIDLISTTDPPNGPISGQTKISVRNDHLSYILTWYSLTIATSYLWHKQFIRRMPVM
ncbi:surfeit locus protein 1 [Prorops nasuta]|uniref:surfeit locus protein 1 n=1 Tax=Prorops nasuta TaxID=863751 RepID=UPI0034CEE9B6